MIDGDQYVSRISSVKRQFELVRNALCEFKNDQARLDALAKKEISGFVRMISNLSGKSSKNSERETTNETLSPEALANAKQHLESIGQEAKDKFIGEVDDALNRVNQNELILLVALFEVQMKDIHRAILRQDKSLLNSERQIPLGKLVADGAESVIDIEIEREIQSLDRKNVSARAKYFKERLQLDWTECIEIDEVAEAIESRNRLLHDDPGMMVTNEKIKQVFSVSLMLPFHCCSICVKRYPGAFHQAPFDVYAEAAEMKLYSDEDWTPSP